MHPIATWSALLAATTVAAAAFAATAVATTATATATTTAVAADARPLPAEQCASFAKEFAKLIGRQPLLVIAAPSSVGFPYPENLPKGQACVFTAKAKGLKAAVRAGGKLSRWKIEMADRGWTQADEISTEGDEQIGLGKGVQRLAVTIEEHPAPGCRELAPYEKCRAPDAAHDWVFHALVYER